MVKTAVRLMPLLCLAASAEPVTTPQRIVVVDQTAEEGRGQATRNFARGCHVVVPVVSPSTFGMTCPCAVSAEGRALEGPGASCPE